MKIEFCNKHTREHMGVCHIPNWMWGGVKDIASYYNISESTVLRRALSSYLASKNISSKNFAQMG